MPFDKIKSLIESVEAECLQKIGKLRILKKEVERIKRQETINKLLADMTGYNLPVSIANEVLSKFGLDSERGVETLSRTYTEETFCNQVYSILSEKSLEEIMYSSPEKFKCSNNSK